MAQSASKLSNKNEEDEMTKATLNPIRRAEVQFTIKGTAPLITHNWDEKAKTMMREKQAGKKTKKREVREPERETEAACYRTKDGRYGIPGMGFKAALISAAHKDLGIEKTLVRKALFLKTSDPNKVLPMDCSEPVMREDMVRVGAGSADIRYRPMFEEWFVPITLEVDMDLLTADDVLNLVNRAGFGIGLCEWRPEKNGEFGRFEIDQTQPFTMEEL